MGLDTKRGEYKALGRESWVPSLAVPTWDSRLSLGSLWSPLSLKVLSPFPIPGGMAQ